MDLLPSNLLCKCLPNYVSLWGYVKYSRQHVMDRMLAESLGDILQPLEQSFFCQAQEDDKSVVQGMKRKFLNKYRLVSHKFSNALVSEVQTIVSYGINIAYLLKSIEPKLRPSGKPVRFVTVSRRIDFAPRALSLPKHQNLSAVDVFFHSRRNDQDIKFLESYLRVLGARVVNILLFDTTAHGGFSDLFLPSDDVIMLARGGNSTDVVTVTNIRISDRFPAKFFFSASDPSSFRKQQQLKPYAPRLMCLLATRDLLPALPSTSFSALRFLTLLSVALCDKDVSGISQSCPALVGLSLMECTLTAGHAAQYTLPTLSTLVLHRTDPSSFAQFVAANPTLTALEIRAAMHEDTPPDPIISACTKLQITIPPLPIKTYAIDARWARLRSLAIDGAEVKVVISHPSLASLSASDVIFVSVYAPALTSLSLSAHRQQRDVLAVFSPPPSALQTLQLSNARYSMAQAHLFGAEHADFRNSELLPCPLPRLSSAPLCFDIVWVSLNGRALTRSLLFRLRRATTLHLLQARVSAAALDFALTLPLLSCLCLSECDLSSVTAISSPLPLRLFTLESSVISPALQINLPAVHSLILDSLMSQPSSPPPQISILWPSMLSLRQLQFEPLLFKSLAGLEGLKLTHICVRDFRTNFKIIPPLTSGAVKRTLRELALMAYVDSSRTKALGEAGRAALLAGLRGAKELSALCYTNYFVSARGVCFDKFLEGGGEEEFGEDVLAGGGGVALLERGDKIQSSIERLEDVD
jgi:hypothetical protein